jgi:hypothetical protein
MSKFTTTLLIAIAAFFFVSCDKDSDGPATAEQIAYEEVTTSVHLQVDDPHTEVFRNQSQWNEFWALHPECNSGCVFSPPYVDFDSSTVVGIFWGLEGAIGLDLTQRVEKISRTNDNTFIHLREQSPFVEALPAEGYSYLFLKFERAEGAVLFTGVVPL